MSKLSKRLRFEILRRDQFRCRYCGTVAAEAELRVDHVIPEVLGGPTEPTNLVTACDPCNNGKSSTTMEAPLVDEVAEGALRWSRAMQQAAAALEEKFLVERDGQGEFLDLWNAYKIGGNSVPLPADWDSTITRLRASGLTLTLIDEAIDSAMRAHNVRSENRFRYFCGVGWRMVTQIQKAAQDIVVGDEPREPAQPHRYKTTEETVARALDAAMDTSGISLESWQYDELVTQLAAEIRGR